jgi:hypothetical protein
MCGSIMPPDTKMNLFSSFATEKISIFPINIFYFATTCEFAKNLVSISKWRYQDTEKQTRIQSWVKEISTGWTSHYSSMQ